MCHVFVNKVQLAFGNGRERVSVCLNDDTTHPGTDLNWGLEWHEMENREQRENIKISKFKYLEARATGSHLNPINS